MNGNMFRDNQQMHESLCRFKSKTVWMHKFKKICTILLSDKALLTHSSAIAWGANVMDGMKVGFNLINRNSFYFDCHLLQVNKFAIF